jgi:hypothetical protein
MSSRAADGATSPVRSAAAQDAGEYGLRVLGVMNSSDERGKGKTDTPKGSSADLNGFYMRFSRCMAAVMTARTGSVHHYRYGSVPAFEVNISHGEIHMDDLVDIAIPSNAQATAEGLGLTVHRTVTSGAWVRRLPRDEAEIAIEYLRDYGFSARIVDSEIGRA